MESIRNDILKEFEVVRSLNDLNELKVKYIGKKGIITLLYTKMKEIPSDEKKEYGMKINNLKTLFNDKYEITIYSSCCNLNKGTYYYNTYNNHQINCIDMHKENLDSDTISRYPISDEEVINMIN